MMAGEQASQRPRPALLAPKGTCWRSWAGRAGPGGLVIAAGQPAKLPCLPFAHRNHARFYRNVAGEAIACVVCHHTEEGELSAPPPLCAEYHGTLDNPVDDNPLLMHIFHLRCVQCHRDTAAAGGASGPHCRLLCLSPGTIARLCRICSTCPSCAGEVCRGEVWGLRERSASPFSP